MIQTGTNTLTHAKPNITDRSSPGHRTPLQQELAAVGDRLVREADLVIGQVEGAVAALISRDREAAMQVRRNDDAVDREEVNIEEACLKILALHKPVAIDLRKVTLILKVNEDLERIADHAGGVAKAVSYLDKNDAPAWPQALIEMSGLVGPIIRRTRQALIDESKGVSRELPNERFGVHRGNQKGINGSKPVIICLDEFAKCRQFIKDVLAPVFYEHRIGQYHMPEGSIVFGCTNLSQEGLGDSIQAHLRDRLVMVRMAKPTMEEWVLWAAANDISPEIMAAAQMYPDIFDTFTDYLPGGSKYNKNNPVKKANPYIFDPSNGEQDKWVTPRSLHAASDIVKQIDNIDEDTLTLALEGTLGTGFTGKLMSFIRFGQELPPFSRVCDEPEDCPVPKNPTAQLVQVFQFVTQVKNTDMAEAVSTYVERMNNEMQSLFVHTVANSARVDNFVMSEKFGLLMKENRIFFNN